MKQSKNKQQKKKRAAGLRKIVSLIGWTSGFAMLLYRLICKRRKEQSIHTDRYIPIGNSTNTNGVNEMEEIAVTKEVWQPEAVTECTEEQGRTIEQLIQDILQNELHSAKKVWVTNLDQEEMQVEKHIFLENGHFFLGNSEKNVRLQYVYKLKYRNKIYLDRNTINM